MRKIIIIIVVIVIVILCVFFNWYTKEKNELLEINNFNIEYTQYTEKSITGVDLTTVIYKAIDNNEQNEIIKDDSGLYIDDNENYVEIYVNITVTTEDEEEGEKEEKYAYPMEAFDEIGVSEFTRLYGSVLFKCVDTKYHENGKISELIFEMEN